MKLKNKSRGKFVGLSSFIAVFALLATAVCCPFDGNSVEAASRAQRLTIDFIVREKLSTGRLSIDFFLTKSGEISYENIAKQLGIDFYIKEKIYLGIDGLGNVSEGDAGFETAQVADGTTYSGKTDFAVGTNNAGGLVIKVSSENPNMVNSDYSTNVLAPVESATVLGQLPVNHWGYNLTETDKITSLSSLAYIGATTEQAEVLSLGNGDHNVSLAFGAKVGAGTAAGEYASTVELNVSTSPAGRAIRDDNLRTIEAVFNEYMEENPEFAAEVRAKQEERRIAYELEMNGGVAETAEENI